MEIRDNEGHRAEADPDCFIIPAREEYVGVESSRPPCPYCGAPHPASSGANWRCSTCGGATVKHPRGRDHLKVSGREDIRCPDCGENNPVSWGERWQCRNIECGRKWRKKSANL